MYIYDKSESVNGEKSSMPSAFLFGIIFMEEFLLSYFKNHFSTEERTETFTVALSLFCLLVTQFYKGKLYMDDAMHKNLFTILIKTITLCSSIIPCYLYDPTPIPTTTINQNLYQNKDSAMFITV